MSVILVYETAISATGRIFAAPFPEIVLPLSGTVLTEPAGLRAGMTDVLLCPADPARRLAALGSAARAAHFQLSAPLADRLAQVMPLTAVVERVHRLGESVPRLLNEYRAVDGCSTLLLEAAVCCIFALTKRGHADPRRAEGRYSREVTRAIQFAADRLGETIPLTQLANAAGLSLRALNNRFALELHRSPAAFIRDLRIREAERLLRETNSAIGEIALRCGFYDHAHFARTFRDYHGVSPAEYRRAFRLAAQTLPSASSGAGR